MSVRKLFGSRTWSDEEHWISVSDLMAGLMVIFLACSFTRWTAQHGAASALRRLYASFKQQLVSELCSYNFYNLIEYKEICGNPSAPARL